MACIGWDGQPTRPAKEMMKAVSKGAGSPEAAVKETRISLFLVRSGLRELEQGGFLGLDGDQYSLTDKGVQALA